MQAENYIKEIRLARELSQEDLAEKLGTRYQQISYLELGKRRLTWEWMLRLADALECHPLDLVRYPHPYETTKTKAQEKTNGHKIQNICGRSEQPSRKLSPDRGAQRSGARQDKAD